MRVRAAAIAVASVAAIALTAVSASAGDGPYRGPLRPLLPAAHETSVFESRHSIRALASPNRAYLRAGFDVGFREDLEANLPAYSGSALVFRYRDESAARTAFRQVCGKEGGGCVQLRNVGKVDASFRYARSTPSAAGVVFCHVAIARRVNIYIASTVCAVDPHQIGARNAAVELLRIAAEKLVTAMAR